jgi:hypothetical protein
MISFLQWRTAERKRKRDLFDKPWEFFKRARAVYEQGPRAPDGYYYHSADFEYLADEAGFLFGPDIEAVIWSFSDHFKEKETRDMTWYVKPFKKYTVVN